MSTAKLYNIGYVSSAAGGKISGGSIYGNWLGQIITDAYLADNLTLTSILQIQDSGAKLSTWCAESSSKLNSGAGWNKAWASAQIASYEAGSADWSTITINADKDWSNYTIYNVNGFSSQILSSDIGMFSKVEDFNLGCSLQVSGATFLSGTIYTNASEISGLAAPTYNSGVANKFYVDNESPLTFSIANVRISAQQVIPLVQFTCPLRSDNSSEQVYVWKACACDSSQASRNGLCIQILSGNTIVYTNSSATLTKGYPLATTDGGKTTIRFGYSSQNDSSLEQDGIFFGTALMQVSVT